MVRTSGCWSMGVVVAVVVVVAEVEGQAVVAEEDKVGQVEIDLLEAAVDKVVEEAEATAPVVAVAVAVAKEATVQVAAAEAKAAT